MATEYVMTAILNGTTRVYWSVINAPDTTGEHSGFQPSHLTAIVVDYTIGTTINGNAGPFLGYAAGDLFGVYPNPTVAGIQNIPVSENTPVDGAILTYVGANNDLEFKQPSIAGVPFSSSAPTDGQVLTYVGANNDIEFKNPSINGVPFSSTAPTDGYVLTYSLANNDWEPKISAGGGGGSGNLPPVSGTQYAALIENPGGNPVFERLTQDMILPGFSISSFSGGSVVECGSTVTNPVFNASYSSIPISATITNTDAIGSPLNLSTPFTFGTVIGSFHHNPITSVIFTLTAIKGVTKTATTAISFEGRSFFGVGTPGATSVTASGNTAVLVGATGTLAINGLYSSVVGQSFGPVTPTSQNIYLVTPHGSPHVFKDQNGFTFPMNAPITFTFTNQHGATLSYDLYQSTNSLSSTFTLTVVS